MALTILPMRPKGETLADDIRAYAPSFIAITALATIKIAILAVAVALIATVL